MSASLKIEWIKSLWIPVSGFIGEVMVSCMKHSQAAQYTTFNENLNLSYSVWQSDSELDILLDDLETFTEWKFKAHLYFGAGQWQAGETYVDEVLAVVEEQYLSSVPAPFQHTIRRSNPTGFFNNDD